MSHVRRLPIVAVIGSGDPNHGNLDLSEAIGRLIAETGFHLLTGGGRGVMADASRGFTSVPNRAGLALGIIPRSATGDEEKEGYPNPWVELPIRTHLAGRLGPDGEDSRNPINVLTAWRIIALPGNAGTRAEIRLAVRYGRPVQAVTDGEREQEEAGFLDFLREIRVEHQAVRREGGGWDLEGVRGFLA
ncbi:MAG TPA: DNA-binding protein [Thermoanaerobaculia bacterium]|nr:DNA-binding protein [Thermoanaerobaculia bacterium]